MNGTIHCLGQNLVKNGKSNLNFLPVSVHFARSEIGQEFMGNSNICYARFMNHAAKVITTRYKANRTEVFLTQVRLGHAVLSKTKMFRSSPLAFKIKKAKKGTQLSTYSFHTKMLALHIFIPQKVVGFLYGSELNWINS